MKKILFINPRLYPCDQGGVELFHYYFIKAVSEHFEVLVLTNCKEFENCKNIEVLHYPQRLCGKATFSALFYHLFFVMKHRSEIGLINIPYESKTRLAPYHLVLIRKIFKIPYILRVSSGKMHTAFPFFLHQKLFDYSAGIVTVSSPMKKEYQNRQDQAIS